MFNFPEEMPVDFIVTDVAPGILSDGIFFYGGTRGPTHKCVAKQLRPVKRKPNDPIVRIAKLEPRVLDLWATRGRAYYADTSYGVNARDLHTVLRSIPAQSAADRKRGAIMFPRSPRYDYHRYPRTNCNKVDDPEMLMNRPIFSVNSNISSKCDSSTESPSQEIEKPFWWKPNSSKENYLKLPVRTAGVHKYHSIGISSLSKKMEKSSVDRDDKYNCDDDNRRWRTFYGDPDIPKTESERTTEMAKLLKPYLHELDTWYKNL